MFKKSKFKLLEFAVDFIVKNLLIFIDEKIIQKE